MSTPLIPGTAPVAIVTAAGSGIGRGMASELAKAGYRVSLLDIDGTIEGLAHELGGIATVGSLTDPADLARLVDTTVERYGRIDAVVNGAGHARNDQLLKVTDQDWHDGLDMLLLSVVRMARLVTPHMEAAGKGAFVNLSSYTAFEPMGQIPVNSSLRAALTSFTKLYADQYAAKGIRMNSLLPGFVNSWPEDPEFLAKIPAGRYATTEEIGRLARFLVSDDAAYINGESIRIDGGAARSL
ncbi:3-oxoacyl-ACP reductase [Streptomyces eurocidicus]|uniref:3-oxoacyl-ACP reductase n=1 Tax=Streptomyces eurocidicus TaxID=66423 RepID=A0A2N8NWQ7_STREU|nr:SDR family oxidoreductase [Streptomyces eurocidicus]MBB5117992.1 NAD(P)-dependent dehydrogenase (short-subunit alcohol dehydrogenase family) [Streptomyces eurocidicus]MBF6053971.1 SDR family oxidoreductase [Streptomyces eurocidicus]PNE33208.1 3-oxoacyl-ACP reductase [Streptomyces eurocidicus]